MKKKKPSLIFEQLEERIFLDTNPLLILDPAINADLEPIDVPLESAAETAASEPSSSEDPLTDKETAKPI